MAGAMNEPIAISTRFDNGATGIIDFAALHRLARSDALSKQSDCRIARITNGVPHVEIARGWTSERGHPRLVGEDSAVLPAPDIQKKNVPTPYLCGSRFAGLVMGIG